MTMRIPLRLLVALGAAASATVALADEGFGLQAGAAVIVAPRYEGSKEVRVLAVPILSPAGLGDGRVEFRGPDDLRFRLLDLGAVSFGPLVGYRFGREEDDGDLLNGLGDIDGGIVGGGFASVKSGPLAASVSYHRQFSGDDTGAIVRLGLSAEHAVTERVTVTADIGTTWADQDYMDAYFGIDAAQSANSGLAVHTADASIKDVNVGLKAGMMLTDAWKLTLAGRYTRLLGDAADSPVVETANQFSGSATATYRFNWGQ
jgi:MipA family protein